VALALISSQTTWLAKRLGFKIYQGNPSYVRLGDGNHKQTHGSSNNVQIKLGDCTMIEGCKTPILINVCVW